MEILLLVLAALTVACLANPGVGMLIVVAAGFLQDPLRKLAPRAPVVFVATVLGLYAAVVAGMFADGAFGRLRRSSTLRKLREPLVYFLLLVVAQSLNALLRSGSAVLPAIGLASYAAPAIAGGVGFVIALRPERLLRVLRFYAWCGLAAAASVLVARFYPNLAIFKPVGTGLMVYGEEIGVRLASGFLRTSEVAAWHAATTGCVLLLLLAPGRSSQRARVSLPLAAVGLPLIVLAIVWTGRRKALVELAIFVLVYGLLLLRLRGANRRLLAALALGGILFAYQVIEGAWAADSSREASYLLKRGGTTTAEGGTRLAGAIRAVPIALARNGVLGLGAGVAAQGSQYFGGGKIAGWEAEYGVGRIATELGLMGLVLIGWIVVRLGTVVRRGLRVLARQNAESAKLAFGLLAILVANAAVFITAAQIFGDPFIYLLLGTIAGGLGSLIEQGHEAERRGATAADLERAR